MNRKKAEELLGPEKMKAFNTVLEYGFNYEKLYAEIDRQLDVCLTDDSKEEMDKLWNLLVAAQTMDKMIKNLAKNPHLLDLIGQLGKAKEKTDETDKTIPGGGFKGYPH